MTIVRLRYVHRYRDRHGRLRYYLRQPGARQVALPGTPGSTAFMMAYQAAMLAPVPLPAKPGSERVKPGTLDALAVSWYATPAFTGLKATTQVVYRRIIEGLRAKHGHRLAADLEPQHVEKLVAEKASTPAAANHRLRVLRSLVAHGVSLGMIDRHRSPVIGVRRLKEAAQGAASWTDRDIAAFDERWPIGTRERLAKDLLFYTAQRRGDVVRLGRQHMRGGWLVFTQQKTGMAMEIPIDPDLQPALMTAPADHLTFLVTAAGAAFTPNGFYNWFAAAARSAGLPSGRSPHGLRKARARVLAEAGCTPHEIAAWTGHATLSEVQRYTKAAEKTRLAQSAMVKLHRVKSGTS